MVRVLVVDDYHPWLRFIRSMLQEALEFQIIEEASDGQEAVEKAGQLQPDLILLDIGLPTFSGIEAARQVRKCAPKSRILFVSEQRSEDVVREALSVGSGYVVKSYAARELLPAMKAVLEGGRPVSTGAGGQNFNDSEGKLMQSARPTARNHHELNSFPDKAAFVDGFARFVGKTLESGAIIILATESHRVSVLQRLKAEGVDVAAAIQQKRYIPLDIPDGFHTFQLAEHLAADAVKAATERNLHVGVG